MNPFQYERASDVGAALTRVGALAPNISAAAPI
jgi:hypothetical protein